MKCFVPGIILFCLLSTLAKAQPLSLKDQYNARLSYGRNHLKMADIQGSPYLDSEYKVGSFLTDAGELYKDIPLRYNCCEDILEFKKGDVAYELVPKSKVKRAEFGNKVFVYSLFESDGKIDTSYFEVLAVGKAALYAQYSIKFYEAAPLQAYSDPKPARFDDFSESHYISIDNSPAKKISTNKNLIELLADKQKEVKDFISKQKLSAKRVDDLKKIIAYYNTL